MAVAAFRSTTRKQYDIRGVEIEDPLGGRSINRSPSRRRSISRQPSPTRRSMSKAFSPTRRRSMSKAPSPTRRRSLSKAPSPTRGRRGVSRNPSPTRRSLSKAPSPTRRLASRAVSPAKTRRLSPSRNPSPTRGRRGISRGSSPTRGRRGFSRGSSPARNTRLAPATPARAQSQAISPTRRRDPSVGPRSRATSPQRLGTARANARALRTARSTADVALPLVQPDSPVHSDPPPVVMTIQSGIRRRGASRMHPSDSESEVEPRYGRGLDRSGSFSTPRDSSDNESIQSSTSTSKRNLNDPRERISRRTSSTHLELRRSLANLDLTDASIPAYYQKPKTAGAEDHRIRNAVTDDGYAQVEGRVVEKTIQEVHTQTKVQNLCYNSLYDVSAPTDALSPMETAKSKVAGNSREAPMQGDVDLVALYNARCAELWKVVSDTRNELKNVKEEGLRKVIEAKLKMSERKVAELWSQYATEEQRCLHLVKSMEGTKQGSVDPPDMGTGGCQSQVLCLEEDLKNQHHHGNPVEDVDESDFIRQSLDEEAARYFEECAIIANFDANVLDIDDISVSDGRSSDGESSVCDDPRPLSRRQSSNSPEVASARKKVIKPLDDEGMLLPWLDWEPEFDLGRKERIEKAICDFQEWKSAWDQKSEEWGKSSNRERGKDEGAVHVDEFLFERTRLQPRVSQGRMLVCGGKR